MKAMLIATLCTLALLGCKPDSAPNTAPIVRGEVVTPGVSRMSLSPNQLAGCIEWLQARQSDWGKLRSLPPTPVQSVVLNHSDGARTQLEFYTGRAGWNNTLLIKSFDKSGELQFTGIDEFDESDIALLKASLPRPQ